MFPMHTGLGGEIDNDAATSDLTMKAVALMLELVERAADSAAEYAHAANRSTVTATDIRYALMYEAHEFWERHDLESNVTDKYNAIKTDSEGSSSDSASESESEQSLDDDAVFTRADDSVSDFAAKVNHYHDNWHSWNPSDPIIIALKNSIDAQ